MCNIHENVSKHINCFCQVLLDKHVLHCPSILCQMKFQRASNLLINMYTVFIDMYVHGSDAYLGQEEMIDWLESAATNQLSWVFWGEINTQDFFLQNNIHPAYRLKMVKRQRHQLIHIM